MNRILSYCLSLFGYILLTSCNKNVEPAKYLIPENFTGKVSIFLSVKSGVPAEYEGDYRIFRINENGCCISQFTAEYDGWSQDKFYLINSNGDRKEIDQLTGFKTHSDDTTGKKRIFHGTTGELGPEKPNMHYISFIVCTAQEYEKWVQSDLNKSCLENVSSE